MRKFDGFIKRGQDSEVEDQITAHCVKHGIDALDAIKLFPVLARRQWLKRFLAHAELFKLALEVPGDIAELGVFRGLGLMTWANLLEAYSIGNRTKVVYGFDNWAGFEKLSAADGGQDESAQRMVGGYSPADSHQEVLDAVEIFDRDRFIPAKARIKLVDGRIEETVPRFVEENPGVRFSLVHFDCDLYEPTLAALKALWPRITRNGVVLFDEYAIKDWPGETKAVDEFFAGQPGVVLKILTWTNSPAAFLIKP